MAQDLPLILMNMSGMNGNLASQSDSSDQKMKLLFYGLGTLPVELLFSGCARLGCCEMDSWIPREIVPETFSGKHAYDLVRKDSHFINRKAINPWSSSRFLARSSGRTKCYSLYLTDRKMRKGAMSSKLQRLRPGSRLLVLKMAGVFSSKTTQLISSCEVHDQPQEWKQGVSSF